MAPKEKAKRNVKAKKDGGVKKDAKLKIDKTKGKQGKTSAGKKAADVNKGSSSHKLKIGAWNAAAWDAVFKATARQGQAASFFKGRGGSGHHHVVICPEAGDKVHAAFRGVGYEVLDCQFGLALFFDPQILKRTSKLHTLTVRGGGEKPFKAGERYRDGTAGIQMFKHKITQEKVLVVAVHAGHYGNSEDLVKGNKPTCKTVRENAEKAIHELRRAIEDTCKSCGAAGKVIVGGDFNELGALIEHDRIKFKPLPASIPHARGSIHVHATLKTTGTAADHIWVGGSKIDTRTLTEKRDAAFGSDHHALSIWGV